jgi:hypothetical protein
VSGLDLCQVQDRRHQSSPVLTPPFLETEREELNAIVLVGGEVDNRILHMSSLIRSILAIELKTERALQHGIKGSEGTGRVVLEDRAQKASRDDRGLQCIVEENVQYRQQS